MTYITNLLKYKAGFLTALLIATVSSLLISLSACTQNDGNIGIYFGSWTFESIEVDGNELPDYENGDLMIAFQSNIFRMDYENKPTPEIKTMFGTWSEDADHIILDGSADHKEGEFPPLLGVDPNGVFTFRILEKKGKTMIWQRTDDEGRTWTYRLKRMMP